VRLIRIGAYSFAYIVCRQAVLWRKVEAHAGRARSRRLALERPHTQAALGARALACSKRWCATHLIVTL
jgi:hypothetical protein